MVSIATVWHDLYHQRLEHARIPPIRPPYHEYRIEQDRPATRKVFVVGDELSGSGKRLVGESAFVVVHVAGE